MKLSVVIVSYNVRSYLEQCLQSVQRALEGIEGEVFVVDNHSSDDSVEVVKCDYAWVKLMENKENQGFARANNLAIPPGTGRIRAAAESRHHRGGGYAQKRAGLHGSTSESGRGRRDDAQ